MDFKGFAMLKSLDHCFIGLNPEIDADRIEEMKSTISQHLLPIMDVAVDGSGLLLLGPGGDHLIDTRTMEDVYSWFECDFFGDVLLPKGLSEIEKMAESGRRLTRKSGYGPLVRKMVIMNSLSHRAFNDDFLFAMQ